MSNLNVDTVTAANVQATGMVSANTALKAPNYADAGKPASADPGVIIYNTTGQDVELWKGSSWLSLGAGNMRTWSGEEGRPTSPSTGQFGFNITTGQAEIFNGSDWVTFGSNAAEGASGLFEFSSFTFLSIVSRGSRNGPNSSQMTSAYSGETWNDGTNFKQGDYQGYQVWTVPEDGTYTIEAGGAKGGRDLNYGMTNLWGAKISGQFTLTKGTELSMVVGVGGGQYYSPHGNEAGGGGGSLLLISQQVLHCLLLVVEEVVLLILMDGLVVEVHQLDKDNLVSMVVVMVVIMTHLKQLLDMVEILKVDIMAVAVEDIILVVRMEEDIAVQRTVVRDIITVW